MKRRLCLLTLVLVGCEPAPNPSGQQVLLRVELSGAGVVQDLTARLERPDRVPAHARSRAGGELTVEVLDGETVRWTGEQYAPLFEIDETFSMTGTTGELVPLERSVVYLAFDDDGRAEVPLRLRMRVAGADEALVVERTVTVERPEDLAASGGGLIEVSDDIAGRREALCNPIGERMCSGPEQFCVSELPSGSFLCRDEACLPDATWDGAVTELQSGDSINIVFLPLGFAGPDDFEAYISDVLDNMHTRVDWYAENQGRIGFSVWRQLCEYDTVPTLDDTSSLMGWLRGLEEQTRLLPSFDKYIVVSNADTCRGRAQLNGRFSALTGCMSDLDHGADDLAHELGHLVAGLTDEYGYDSTSSCDDAAAYPLTAPNIAPLDDPHWFCEADTGDVYAGQECGTIGGGVVGAFRGPANSCSNDVARPCSSSMMGSNWDNQLDPVGYGAMTYSVDNGGARMGYTDCDAGCDNDCSAIDAGSCGLSACFQLCDGCATGESCRGALEIGYTCNAACDPMFNSCESSFGFEFCHGDTALTTDAACAGYRIAGCDNGRLVPMGCVM